MQKLSSHDDEMLFIRKSTIYEIEKMMTIVYLYLFISRESFLETTSMSLAMNMSALHFADTSLS